MGCKLRSVIFGPKFGQSPCVSGSPGRSGGGSWGRSGPLSGPQEIDYLL